MAVALEAEHGVDHVLERARAGQATVLGDVPDQHDGQVALLGLGHQAVRAPAHLDDAARRRAELGIGDGLDAVDDDERRAYLVDRRQDVRQRGLGQHPQVAFAERSQAAGTQAHLLGALLGADVQARSAPGEQQLGEQRALADPRLAAEQGDGAGDQPAAEHPVQFADARGCRPADEHVDVGEQGRHVRREDDGGCRRIGTVEVLDERVPRRRTSGTGRPTSDARCRSRCTGGSVEPSSRAARYAGGVREFGDGRTRRAAKPPRRAVVVDDNGAMPGAVVRFADCAVDLGRFEIHRAGRRVHVEPQVFDVLAYLVAHRERMVPKHELLDEVWGSRFVSESALATRIHAARAAVGDDGQRQEVIRTVHGRGYRFVAEVDEIDEGPESSTATPPVADDSPEVTSADEPSGETEHLEQVIRFARADDGTRIAWATIGRGPTLVKAANWMTHLDYDWETPVWRHWLEGLASGRRLVRYDERGCGMSDWDTPIFDFDAWVDDLALVVDAAGLERFPLLGVSGGAAVAIAYAVRHPERVSCLVLAGAYARGRLVRAVTEEQRREAALDVEVARVGWGRDDVTFRQVFTSQFLPDGTAADWAEFNEVQRRSTSSVNAVRFLEEFALIDVSDEATRVSCPTLLLHSRDDLRVPLANARELAAAIPGSRLVPLDSRNHILTAREPAWPVFLRELDGFVAEHAGNASAPRRRATD